MSAMHRVALQLSLRWSARTACMWSPCCVAHTLQQIFCRSVDLKRQCCVDHAHKAVSRAHCSRA